VDSLFFLDEPTSGLDSQAAYSIVYFLRKIAAEGLPVICTIHQPNGVLFEMFDHVLLLAPGGRTIYFGETGTNAEKVATYFGLQGAHIQSHENPAEFMISTISGPGISEKWHENWLESAERAEVISRIAELNDSPAPRTIDIPFGASQSYALPLMAQTIALTRRHWISTFRDGSYNFSKTFKSLFCQMFTAFTFFNLGSDLQGIQNYVLSLLILVQIIPALAPDIQAKWLSKWALFEARERNGIYDYKALTAALIIVEIPWQLFNFSLMYFVSYWTVSWPNTSYSAGYSFVMWLVLSYFATSWSQLIASIFPAQTVGLANALFWNVLIAFSGVLVPQAALNIFYRNWLWWLDPFRWFLGGHVEATLHNVRVTCAPKDLAVFDPRPGQTCGEYAASFLSTATGYLTNPQADINCGYCPYTTGDQYAATMNFHPSQRWRDFGLCIVFCVSNTVLVFAVIWFTKARGRGIRSG
jgi:ATP-binding cassette subfamily G (WHITE) protein 2 (SNQ2)